MHQETSLGNSIGLIIELLRHQLIEIFQLLILQNLRMQPCHTIDRISRHNRKMRHLHLTVPQDRHLLDLILIPGIGLADLLHESPVNLLNDLVNTWQKP